MKKVLALSILPLSMLMHSASLQAATPGAYAGLGLGYSTIDIDTNSYYTTNVELAGRGFAGYNFNKYFGVEGTYSNLNSHHYSSYYYGLDTRLNALSLVAKGYLPLSRENRFNLYGLVGVSEVFSQYDLNYFPYGSVTINENATTPTFGFGLSYQLNDKFTLGYEASVFGSQDNGSNNIGIPMSAIATLNLSYHF